MIDFRILQICTRHSYVKTLSAMSLPDGVIVYVAYILFAASCMYEILDSIQYIHWFYKFIYLKQRKCKKTDILTPAQAKWVLRLDDVFDI